MITNYSKVRWGWNFLVVRYLSYLQALSSSCTLFSSSFSRLSPASWWMRSTISWFLFSFKQFSCTSTASLAILSLNSNQSLTPFQKQCWNEGQQPNSKGFKFSQNTSKLSSLWHRLSKLRQRISASVLLSCCSLSQKNWKSSRVLMTPVLDWLISSKMIQGLKMSNSLRQMSNTLVFLIIYEISLLKCCSILNGMACSFLVLLLTWFLPLPLVWQGLTSFLKSSIKMKPHRL